MKKTKRKLRMKNVVIILLMLFILIGSFCFYSIYKNKNKYAEYYLANNIKTVDVYNENKELVTTVSRGVRVRAFMDKTLDGDYVKITLNDNTYYVLKQNLVKTKDLCVQEKKVYVRTAANLKETTDGTKLLSLANKGDELEVIGYDVLNEDGSVNMYKVKTTKQEEGYYYQEYVLDNLEEASAPYDKDGIYKIHAKVGNTLGGGSAKTLDYYPVIKPKFADNQMPDNVYALYLNGTKSVISNVDAYIEYAKTTKINAFVVDIKDSGVSAYASLVMKEYSPTSYKYAQNSFDNYKNAIKKIKEAGFYVIGRITTFKDSYYITDNKDKAISNASGSPLYHQSSYWPSAFNRDVWEYNVLLAREAVMEMGFNEIQFDYVRFPDGLMSKEKSGRVNYKNVYNETKAEAIQRFLMYATKELHALNVYVSCDVFGESSSGYVTAYGQYWPALSNVVDAISAMPYTDHFDRTNSKYWTDPGWTMSNWAKTAYKRQQEIKTPAIARTWITAYNTPYWNPTVTYNGEKLIEQIEALYKEGLTGGYMTWNNSSNLTKYKSQKSAFLKEYR